MSAANLPPEPFPAPQPPVPETGWRELGLWLLGRRRRFRVVGPSMQPQLQPGDLLLVDPRAYGRDRLASPSNPRPQVGDVVVARPPGRPELRTVKRVARVLPGDRYWLLGDNAAASTDSRAFGAVPGDRLLGKVVSRFPRAATGASPDP